MAAKIKPGAAIGASVGKSLAKKPPKTPAQKVGGMVGGALATRPTLTVTPTQTAPAVQTAPPPQAAVPTTEAAGTGSLGGDAGLLSAQDQAHMTFDLANAGYQNAVTGLGLDFGFDQYGQIAQNNPFSRAALLQESYKRGLTGTRNASAARGNLYAGSTQNALDETSRQYAIGSTQLQGQYRQGLEKANSDRLSAVSGAVGSLSAADWNALLNALGGKSS